MTDVTEKLAPGGEIPWGECELCGSFLYVEELGSDQGKGEVVRDRQAFRAFRITSSHSS